VDINFVMNIFKIKKRNYEGGSILFMTILFLLAFSLTTIYGVINPVLRDMKTVRGASMSRQSFFTSESGVEDFVYRLKNNITHDNVETIVLNNRIATSTLSTNGYLVNVTSVGDTDSVIRLTSVDLVLASGASFNYGVQAGDGGVSFENTASILGNVNSSGPITGSNSNIIYGTAISSGPSGLVDGIHATSSVYAHTIQNADIDGDAYYQNISGSTVDGAMYPGSPDQESIGMPISDEQIEEWKAAALAGGVVSSPCPYKITNATTIGPKKINCNLEISGNNYTINISGNLWIDGDIEIKNSPTLRVADSMSGKSVVIVADNDSNRSVGGVIYLENSSVFEGNGNNSFILFISKNNSASTGGENTAISAGNSMYGDVLLYAPDGEIKLQNSVSIKEVTAYKISIKNSAQIIYETGIANLLFDSGPGGGFEVGDWVETE